jgi:DNA-binding PadR family transcriptional regulator
MYRADQQRSTLEVLILALLEQGLMTTYDLQRQADLSLGATVPALGRLAESKLVTKKASGRKFEFSLTREGEKILRNWTPPQRTPSELDELLRTAYLTWLIARNKRTAAVFLRQGVRARVRRNQELQEESAFLDLSKIKVPGAEAYRWMRTVTEAARAAAEADALEKLANALESQRKRR